MPTAKTECSELSVAFGILGYEETNNLSPVQINNLFNSSLSWEKYQRFRNEYITKPNFYPLLLSVGNQLRKRYTLFNSVDQVIWAGPDQQAITTDTPVDLLVANIPVSVKGDSNVIRNPSPYNLFISAPQASARASHDAHWYFQANQEGYQKLYSFVQEMGFSHFPAIVEDFDASASRQERKLFAKKINSLEGKEKERFYDLYISLCHDVAKHSAKLFNENFLTALSGRTRATVLEYLVKWFYRLNAVSYILCGLDKKQPFAVQVPTITNWKKDWHFQKIEAQADLNRKQSVVDFFITTESKRIGKQNTDKFHAQVRWTHGKFCGNVEAKLYKDFIWKDVQFMKSLV